MDRHPIPGARQALRTMPLGEDQHARAIDRHEIVTFGASLQAEGGEFKVNTARFVHLNSIPLDQ